MLISLLNIRALSKETEKRNTLVVFGTTGNVEFNLILNVICVISLWNSILSYSNRIQVIECNLNEIKMFHSTTDAGWYFWRICSKVTFNFFEKKNSNTPFWYSLALTIWRRSFDCRNRIKCLHRFWWQITRKLLSKLNSTFVHSLSCQGKCSRCEILVLCAQTFGWAGFFVVFGWSFGQAAAFRMHVSIQRTMMK